MNCSKQQGFTLIELMVTVVIVGILAAVAIPNYRDHLANSKLVEGQSTLTMARNTAEQFFQDNRSYTGLCASNTPPASENFSYSCSADDETYTFTATAKSSSGIPGWAFTLDQANTHTTSSTPDGITAPTGCWAKKVKGTC